VKPAKEGAATNLNLMTASGMVYSFLLTEGKTAQPDLKLYVKGDTTAPRGRPKYYSATQVSALESELTDARAAIKTVQLRSDEAIATFRRDYPAALQFAYGTPKYKKPFFVRSIWHDGQFTFIRSDARELPTLYELRDGQPSLVNFQVQTGTYVVPKVLDRGYLALGKERFSFQQGQWSWPTQRRRPHRSPIIDPLRVAYSHAACRCGCCSDSRSASSRSCCLRGNRTRHQVRMTSR
jgi:type IV secretion system protein VirB9